MLMVLCYTYVYLYHMLISMSIYLAISKSIPDDIIACRADIIANSINACCLHKNLNES